MIRTTLVAVAFFLFGVANAHADAAADRASISDNAVKLAAKATSLAKTAEGSDDRAVRKKLAPRAVELSDDLDAVARRTRKDVPLDAIAKDVLALAKDVAELVDLADEASEKEERKSLRAQAQVIEQGVVSLRKTVETLVTRKEERKEERKKPTAVSAEGLKTVVAAIEKESFEDGKLAVVRQVAQTHFFTASQVGTLMGLFSFDDGKVETAVALWVRVVDTENRISLFGKLTFDSSKEKLRKRVGA